MEAKWRETVVFGGQPMKEQWMCDSVGRRASPHFFGSSVGPSEWGSKYLEGTTAKGVAASQMSEGSDQHVIYAGPGETLS